MEVVNAILEEKNDNLADKLHIDKPIELLIDEGTLLVSDNNTFDTVQLRSNTEDYLKSLSRDNVQMLINKIWQLPTERVDEVIVAKLPPPKYVLPRARVVPKPKAPTKWEQFAKEKGIKSQKKSKSKLKWDDELQKWIPTFGYRKAKAEEQKDWLIELNENNQPKVDPREKLSKGKEERVAKNELQRLRNLAKSKKIKVPKVGIVSVDTASSKQLQAAATIARVSTASLGKFQSKLPKEKDAKDLPKDMPGLKRKRKGQPLNASAEKKRNTDLINTIISRKSNKDLLQVDIPTTSSRSNSNSSKKDSKKSRSKAGRKPKAGKVRAGGKNTGGRKRR